MLSVVSTPPFGWYDDPQDPAQQRWWDGVRWGDQRRPRAEQDARPGPAQHGQAYQGAPPYQPSSQQPSQQPYQQGQQPYQQTQPPHQQQNQFQQPAPQQGYGYPAGYGQLNAPVTPDGVPLSGWWKRVAARILDGLIAGIVALPLTGYFLYRYFQVVLDYQRDLYDDALAGRSNGFSMGLPAEAYKWVVPIALISLLVGFAYEYYFLTRTGATPGKKLLGISVRLRDRPGPPPGSAVLKRWGLVSVFGLLAQIPVVGTLAGIVALVDDLWPLGDSKKQALHDKVAGTNVVVGPQPPRT